MSYNTVEIQGTDHEIYGSEADADVYLAAGLHAATWLAALEHERRQALKTACRMIDRHPWQGVKTSGSQALAWPRTGVTDKNGDTVDPNTVPTGIECGQYELALALLNDTDVQANATTGSNVKSVKADTAQVTFFQPTSKSATRFPQIVHELVREFFGSTSLGIVATGTDEESQFEDQDWGYSGEGLT